LSGTDLGLPHQDVADGLLDGSGTQPNHVSALNPDRRLVTPTPCEHLASPLVFRLLCIRSQKAGEWYQEVYGPEDNSLINPNHSRDVYQQDTVSPERVEHWNDTASCEEIHTD
jgi:hypothetical protein